jgi:uncharacterized protein (DUF58 family)
MTTRIHPTLHDLVRLQFETHGFTLLPRQPVRSLLSGRHGSRLRGRGLTFEELRGYRPGDDIRAMDWRATARLRKPHVRIYSEERDRPVLLIVDQRVSMFFGSARTTKATAAAELAALGAWRALEVGDRVGAVIFSDHEVVEIKPHRSRATVMRICHELVHFNGRLTASCRPSKTSALNEALLRAARVARHDHLVVLVTDYDGDDEDTQRLVTRLAAHNDVLAVLVYDPAGIRIPTGHLMEATDGQQRVVIPDGGRFFQSLESEFRKRCEQLRKHLQALRIPILPLCTHDPVPDQVLSALRGQ